MNSYQFEHIHVKSAEVMIFPKGRLFIKAGSRNFNGKPSLMKKVLVFLLMPLFCWSQEVSVQDYIKALDDVSAFKEKFFKAYPLNTEIEPQAITLVEYEYILYQTISNEVPYILIADEAISIGISNDLAIGLKDDFMGYFEKNCKANYKYKPEIGRFTEWHCGGTSFSTIQAKEITMLYLKSKY